MRRGDERGQTTVLIVGFAVVLMMAVALVVNASAAYLQRQSLDSLADGAALVAADAGAEGDDVYAGGLGEDRLALLEATAREAVDDYLARTGAPRTVPRLGPHRAGRPGHAQRPGADQRTARAAADHPGRTADGDRRRRGRSRGHPGVTEGGSVRGSLLHHAFVTGVSIWRCRVGTRGERAARSPPSRRPVLLLCPHLLPPVALAQDEAPDHPAWSGRGGHAHRARCETATVAAVGAAAVTPGVILRGSPCRRGT